MITIPGISVAFVSVLLFSLFVGLDSVSIFLTFFLYFPLGPYRDLRFVPCLAPRLLKISGCGCGCCAAMNGDGEGGE